MKTMLFTVLVSFYLLISLAKSMPTSTEINTVVNETCQDLCK